MTRARILPAAQRVARFAMNRGGMSSRWVEGAGLRLHVYDGPGGGSLPPVVLLHGLGSAGAAFGRLGRFLRPHVRRVVIPELPGHGFSGRDQRPITPELIVDAMTDVVDRVLEEPAIVLGNSLGGAVALRYALRRPERVARLVLCSPAGAPLRDEELKELVATFHLATPKEALAFLRRLYHRPPWFLALLALEFPDVFARSPVREILAHATAAPAHTPDELASLTMPILFLWGRSERLLPASALAYFRAHLPAHAVIEEPEGFGHTPQMEVPERLAARVVAFARGPAAVH